MKARQRGVALLTVLLLVAVMSVLLMAVLDDIRFGLRRASNSQAVAQAQWYALGTESLAQSRIQRMARSDAGRTTLVGDWNDRPFLFPLGEDGRHDGMISVRVADATACFNLNSVVEGAVEQWRPREIGMLQYRALLQALELAPRQADKLVDALVDWIDSDQDPQPAGAEDGAYAARAGVRTSGTLLAEVSELRAIEGYSAEVYAQLRPHVCALPTAELAPVNINTLEDADAVIVSMLTDNQVSIAEGRRILAARPLGGWSDVLAFWGQPSLARAAVPNPVLQQISLRSRYFSLHSEVEYAGAQVVMSALFEHDAGGEARLLARRWSNDE